MFTIAHDLACGPNALAEIFCRLVPATTINRISSPDTFKWHCLLASSNRRMVRSNSNWDFSSLEKDVGIVVLALPECGGLGLSLRNKDDAAAPGLAMVMHIPTNRNSQAYSARAHFADRAPLGLQQSRTVCRTLSPRLRRIAVRNDPRKVVLFAKH